MCLLFIRGSWVRNQKLSLTNFQSLVSSPSILLLLLETILGSNIGCGAIGNNIGRGLGVNNPRGVGGLYRLQKPQTRRLMAPPINCGVNCLQCWYSVFQVPERSSTHHFFVVSSLAYQISSRPLLDWFHLRPYLGLKASTTPD